MEEITYVGEHLWLGQVGHFFNVLSFIAAIVAAISYYFYQQNTNKGREAGPWKTIARPAFVTHAISVFIIFGLIIFAMLNQWYEYYYVFDHVNGNLEQEYILSAFWEGQEGSFQLWMIMHAILGLIILKRKGEWEAPVLAVLAFVQVFLASMIVGVYFEFGDFAYKLGSNPFLLVRDVLDAPIFSNAEYLNLLEGRGLNPLLQNYWNVIHPPTTFMGFASTTIPFAFAIAGLWTGKHRAWLEPGLKWALFSGAVLGTGILMGSFWAYEALTFGGYWAWDPVENGILVPWLTLIAGIHANLISKNTKYSVKSTYFMYIITFVLVVYATFLTRSGILGETSVHAFTEMGLEWQLVAFVLTFLFLGLGMLIYNRKSIDTPQQEEALNSREFWMFIGSLVLLFSGVLIIGSTSLPVYNTIMQIFNPDYVGRVIQDAVPHYNRYQIWIGIFIGILSAGGLFMRYGRAVKTQMLVKHFALSSILAVVATVITSFIIDLAHWQFIVMAWAGFFTAFSNLDYIITVLKGKLSLASSAISHLGFGVMLIGILASGANMRHLSSNPFMFKELVTAEEAAKYVKLYKGKSLFANNYWMTWESDTLINRNRYYQIRFDEVGPGEKIINTFRVRPTSLLSNDFTKVAALNPDTKHYLSKDIFTNLAALPPSKMDIKNFHEMEDTMTWVRYDIPLGEEFETETAKISLDKLHFAPDRPDYNERSHDVGVAIDMTVRPKWRTLDTVEHISSALGLDGNLLYRYPSILEDYRMRVRLVDTLMDYVFVPESDLTYSSYRVKNNESFTFEDFTIQLTGFDNKPSHKNYEEKKGDIAVAANLNILHENGATYQSSPLYIIRDSRPFSIKDMIAEEGLSLRLSDINPKDETFEIKVAKQTRGDLKIPIEISEKLPETNYIWFEAREFPGISLFWGGTVLMMVGLFMAWGQKRKQSKRTL